MRSWLSLLLILSVFWAANEFGPAEMISQRTWIVEGSPGTAYRLDGTLAVNDSSQQVAVLEMPPGARVTMLPDGVLRLNYTHLLAQPREEVRVKLRVRIERATVLENDPPFEPHPVPATPLTAYDTAMQQQAEELVDPESTLRTVAHLVEWVHSTVEYDIRYWGKTENAQTVFHNRRGVCVEYSHLLISLFRSIGLNTRYVSGYVLADQWQPHAWVQVELPGYGWMDADATFNQVGVVDNTHLAMYYGEDQASVYDSAIANQPVTLSTDERILTHVSRPQTPSPLSVFYVSNRSNGDISIHITNQRPDYRYVAYSLVLPNRYGDSVERVLLLSPNEEKTFRYSPRAPFDSGFIYRLPFVARANDFTLQSDFVVERKEEVPPPMQQLPECLSLFILLAVAAYAGGKP